MIVGAGVVGCYLGKLTGMEIWEKNKRIMEKPCSGLLSRTGLDSLDIEYSDCVLNTVRGARFFSGKQQFSVEKQKTQAYVLDRLALQKELVSEARDSGCKITYNKTWNGQQDEYIIGADGALSSVARSMGTQRNYIHTYQIKAEMRKKIETDFVELHLGNFAPGFFGWLIPFDGKHAEIGLGVSHGNPRQAFDGFSKRFQIKKIEKVQSALIPVFDPKQRTVLGNRALVGDAAGQVKATTGGGIIFGCKCAEILARALEKGDLAHYETGWRKRYAKDLKTHLRVRRFLDRIDCEHLFKRVQENKIDRLIEEHGDMDHPMNLARQMLKKPAVWRYLPKFFFASL
jgi:digeranylgeranylglycerophospholipid reductase